MGLFQRRKKADPSGGEQEGLTQDDGLNEQVQDVMKDNLELMKEVVMRIREDPDFAKNIYSNCPRLQHLLDQYPDLRPIFEDPKLVRINFEQVYRDAGGVLPEDEEKKKSWLVWFVNSPIFKVLKIFLFIKKLIACIAGGGFAFISGCLLGCCFEDALEEIEGDGDADGDFDGEDAMDPAKEALNRAADHMEDPEIQEQMQALLDDPDNLQEAIENDPELRALRDSNPLCEELMSDPETMRVLTDPDNLRALGEAPQLIEADFADPSGFTAPDIETGGLDGFGDAGFDSLDGGDDVDFSDADTSFEVEGDLDDGFDDDLEGDDGEGEGDEEEEEEDEAWWEEAEMEEQETDGDAAEGKDGKDGNNAQGKGQAKGQAKKSNQRAAPQQGNGRLGGIMATIGVAATDLIAAQIVGNVFGDGIIPGGEMGGFGGGVGDDIGGGGAFDDAAGISDAADNAGEVIDEDIADVAQDTVDDVDEKAEGDKAAKAALEDADIDKDDGGKKGAAAAGGAAAGGAAVGGAALATGGTRNRSAGAEGEEGGEQFKDEEEEAPKRGRFAMIANLASATLTAAKEHVAVTLLGDDFGEEMVERMEEGDEEEDEDDKAKDTDKDKNKKDGKAEEEPKKRGLFGRGKK